MVANTEQMPWPEPPPQPIRYGLLARFEDYHNGRRDGRKQLPLVIMPEPVKPPTADSGEPDQAEQAKPGVPRAADDEFPFETEYPPKGADETEPAAAPTSPVFTPQQMLEPLRAINPWTPHLRRLRALARELMETERAAVLGVGRDRETQAAKLRAQIVPLTDQVSSAKESLDRASRIPDEGELKERRKAELGNDDGRPDRLIRDRRMAEHERDRVAAEARYRGLLDNLAKAEEALRTHEAEHAVSAEILRARASRISEHFNRRAAIYWQCLVRRHKHGEWLNEALPQIGPDLPDWAVEPIPPDDDT